MGRYNNGDPFVMQTLRYFQQCLLRLTIQPGSRLIKNHDLWLHGEHPGDTDSLFLAEAQIVYRLVSVIDQSHRIDRAFHPLPHSLRL